MRSGKLHRPISIMRPGAASQDQFGATSTGEPTLFASLRAELISLSTDESLQTFGAEAAEAVTFRTRYIDGILLSDTIVYDGDTYDIKGRREIGRREGLELRCERRGE